MRDYAKVEPKMWHGETMKALRKDHKALVVALYLMSSPSSNMLGLFFQPVMYMAYETGLGIEGATKGLEACCSMGFCSYDEATEFVWVHEMAKYQISNELKANDLRCKGVQKEYDALPVNPFLAPFFERYAEAFHMSHGRGMEGATKPLRSQEQEQEQEQDKGAPSGADGGKAPKPHPVEIPDWMPLETWNAFVDMRRAKGKRAPFTVAAAKGIVLELEKLRADGQDVGAVLQQSINNGWSGVFAMKGIGGVRRPAGDDWTAGAH